MTRREYHAVFFWLVGLMVLTIILAFIPMGVYGTFLGYTIAAAKALLIILYFMHVRHASNLVIAFATAAFLWLGILLVLTVSDYATRGWQPASEILRPGLQPLVPPPAGGTRPAKEPRPLPPPT